MSSFRQFNEEQMQRRASNFAQTCNLLSQYIKQRGRLGDLNLEINGRVESLESLVKQRSASSVSDSTTINVLKDKGKSAEQESSQKTPSEDAAAETDSKAAPLTIFYSGRVLVFDDYPESKAKELLEVAKKGSSRISYGISSHTLQTAPLASSATTLPPRREASNPLEGADILSNTYQEKIITADSDSRSKADARISQQIEANSSELRIARRTSIHKFLEKRKDRSAARGPYHQQVQENDLPSSSTFKGDEHLDLKL